jgi:hypothetical protein
MKLDTVKKRVKRFYPKAQAFKELGLYYIGIVDSFDDNIINIFEEYFIQSTETEEEAWNKALICCKTTQNFNRTHPDKCFDEYDETKSMRLKKRATKIHSSRTNNKSKIFIND